MKTPKVSVIMPVFNGEKYLIPAIKSILNQTYKKFELIIINDGSDDKSLRIINSFKDSRIKVITNYKNLGVAKSLNLGLKEVRGKYIARMDADDISAPDRFQKQIDFLEENPKYVLIGSQCSWINEDKKPVQGFKVATDDHKIRQKIYLRNQFHHASVIFRKDAILKVGGYRPLFNGSEDYDLWFRLMKIGKVANLNEILIIRRIYPMAITQKNHIKIEILALIVRATNFCDQSIFRDNLDIVIGLFTFILYKFWLTSLLFQGRLVTPEPDDSSLYLLAAKNLFNIDSFEQFRMFIFSLWLNLIQILSHTNLEQSFQINFYLGVLIMFPSLIFFIRQIEKNVFNRVILITMLGLYTGSGAYHGFYWVLPSFYMMTLLFVLLGLVFSPNSYNIYLIFVLVFLYIFIHPSSILFLLIFPLIFSIYYILRFKDLTQIKLKSFSIFLVGIFCYLIYGLFSKLYPSNGSLNSPSDAVATLLNMVNGKIQFLSTPIIWHEYFKFIFLNTLTILAFFVCLLLCLIYRKVEILTIFLGALIIVGISTINPFGYRSLEFLWPMTFLILGYGLINLRILLKKINLKFSFLSILILGVIFGTLMTILNYIWIKSQAVKDNYNWNKGCTSEVAREYNFVLFDGWESYNTFLLNGFPKNQGSVVTPNQQIRQDDIYIAKDRSQLKVYQPSGLEAILVGNITRTQPFPQYQVANYYWTNIGSNQIENFQKKQIKDCGFFQVYQLKKSS